MDCPYCNARLIDDGVYGYLCAHQSGEVLGTIYKCPNRDGFDSDEEAQEYLNFSEQTLEDLGLDSLGEVSCDSSMHHVSGSFYTDKQDNLHNGYPC